MESILAHMRALGYEPDTGLIPDGKIKRFGKKKNCWIVAFENRPGFVVAVFGNWETGEKHEYSSLNGEMSDADKLQYRLQKHEAQKKCEEERKIRQEEARRECEEKWERLSQHGSSAYLERKKVGAYAIRYEGTDIYVPLADGAGVLWSLQKIGSDGNKYFHPGSRVAGCFHTISGEGDVVYVCEGYATGATIHEATGCTVYVAFNAGNLLTVSKGLQGKCGKIIVAGDDDHHRKPNVGREKACEAARAIGAIAVFPRFKNG